MFLLQANGARAIIYLSQGAGLKLAGELCELLTPSRVVGLWGPSAASRSAPAPRFPDPKRLLCCSIQTIRRTVSVGPIAPPSRPQGRFPTAGKSVCCLLSWLRVSDPARLQPRLRSNFTLLLFSTCGIPLIPLIPSDHGEARLP